MLILILKANEYLHNLFFMLDVWIHHHNIQGMKLIGYCSCHVFIHDNIYNDAPMVAHTYKKKNISLLIPTRLLILLSLIQINTDKKKGVNKEDPGLIIIVTLFKVSLFNNFFTGKSLYNTSMVNSRRKQYYTGVL